MRKKKLKKARAAELTTYLEQFKLLPGETDQTRACSIEEVKAKVTGSPSPVFREHAEAFVAKYREGDLVEEYCSSKRSWNEGIGKRGYRLSRDAQQIAFLMTAVN